MCVCAMSLAQQKDHEKDSLLSLIPDNVKFSLFAKFMNSLQILLFLIVIVLLLFLILYKSVFSLRIFFRKKGNKMSTNQLELNDYLSEIFCRRNCALNVLTEQIMLAFLFRFLHFSGPF